MSTPQENYSTSSPPRICYNCTMPLGDQARMAGAMVSTTPVTKNLNSVYAHTLRSSPKRQPGQPGQALRPPQARADGGAGGGTEAPERPTGGTTTEDAHRCLDGLATALDAVRRATELAGRPADAPERAKDVGQITTADLLTVQPAAAAAAVAADDGDDAAQDDPFVNFDYQHSNPRRLREKIEELRRRPDILRRYQADAALYRREQRERERARLLCERQRQRRIVADALGRPDYEPRPLVEDAVRHHRVLVDGGFFRPERVLLRAQMDGAALDHNVSSVLARKDALDEDRYLATLARVVAPRLEPVLPQIFTNQRRNLGPAVFLAARLCSLMAVATACTEIHASNDVLTRACTVVQREHRAHHCRERWLRIQASARTLQAAALAFLLRTRHRRRVDALRRIRGFALANYVRGTWPAALAVHQSAALAIARALAGYRRTKLARVECVRRQLQRIDGLELPRRIRADKVRALEFRSREESKRKRAGTRAAPPAPVDPDTVAVTQEEVDAAAFAPEAYEAAARLLYGRMVDLWQDDLEECWRICRQRDGYLVATVAFVPTVQCCQAVLAHMREHRGGDPLAGLAEFVSGNGALFEPGPRSP